jgi:hypothetical protein
MYDKCGNLQIHASNVFDKMPTGNMLSYTALIRAYCSVRTITQEGVKLDRVMVLRGPEWLWPALGLCETGIKFLST